MVASLTLPGDAGASPQPKRAREDEDAEMGSGPAAALKASGAAAAAPKAADGGDKKDGVGKGKSNGKGGKAVSSKDLAQIVGDLTRLVLTHDDSLVHLEAIQLTMVLLQEDSALVEVCRAEGAAYHTRAAADADGEGKNKNLGPPHVYIATAGIAMLAAGGCSMEVGGLAGF